MFLFLFFLVNFCVIKLRLNMGDELTYGYVMPLFPVFPVLAVLAQATLAVWLVHMSPIAWIIAPVWIAGGLAVYFLYSRSRALPTEDEIHVLETREPPPGDKYEIMVAVANPENALQLVQTTYKLAGARDARVELLHMVPVPRHVPLSEAGRYMLEGREAILESMLYLAPLYPIGSHIRYCRNPARGIVSAARERRANLLVLGWHGKGRSNVFRVGSTIDPIIERAPCDVVVLKNCGGNRRFRRVLVPVGGGPNAARALEIAGILADEQEGRVTAFTVLRGRSRVDVHEFLADNLQRVGLPEDRVEAKARPGRDVVSAILDEARDYDLVVIGASQDPAIYKIARNPIPETVARRCETPLIMVKAEQGIRGWLKRWF
jgi:nucleotide-binding universal stress UspA family protein